MEVARNYKVFFEALAFFDKRDVYDDLVKTRRENTLSKEKFNGRVASNAVFEASLRDDGEGVSLSGKVLGDFIKKFKEAVAMEGGFDPVQGWKNWVLSTQEEEIERRIVSFYKFEYGSVGK